MLLSLGILLSYLVGSIPTAYIFGKIAKGIDIRKYGSGNVGATNAFRVLGKRMGISVLALDALKGVVCVAGIADYCLKLGAPVDELVLRVLCGVAAVVGHSLTIFLRFKGGKGMATTLGVLIGLALKFPALKLILLAEVLLWLIVFMLSKIVSLASIVSAVFFPIFFIILKQPLPLISASLCLSSFIIIRHKPNIIRMLQNKEPRLNFKKSK
ncbi:MAG: acyl-phosphate glycerol 3-phosphate acyltransferase [Omnitrophica WOR_2 bacterium GWF2_43_52]|nr:MAG: acyl-phosphate glycerol 3-phosphate acyltransferase [Omnitrophica WOR_2 bacterium GWC2_44_8]OGX20986.1 MAG: acyl-phosphate glycerol 3-phosphate acyltransferase [Omnitrophica WOR_2 bacterium GWF2_43_52]HAH21165.1 acyl-phosphate glycerol 3-phosphate acyltransferase [Candidatus Omnitrophota bacterium]HBG63233.1 acyl-phosphate glycerol 3-phosphate acyltransferase [Candidatus Omnitrophota bacterium]HCD37705.1 acyl-phosphate glycerol 3-phosphate acyltransferase [Candidatus Omnitrophota bacter